MHTFYFINAEQALKWSTEVMRKAQFPKISPIYKELLLTRPTEEDRKTLTDWFGETANLPTDYQDRYALAQDVYKVVLHTLSEDDVALVRLKYWGDYVTSHQLAKALKEQDTLRRQGIRTRLNYRHSDRQVGVMLGVDNKTVARRYNKAEMRCSVQQASESSLPLRCANMRQS